MADTRATPTLATEQVSTLDVGPTPTVPAAPPVPQTPPVGGAANPYPPVATAPGETPHAARSDATDPVNGIGAEGEEPVWDAHYSLRNFLGRIVFRTALAIAWLVLAITAWGYDHTELRLPAILAGLVVLALWIGLVVRIIQARFGHHYRLTTRRLFVSTGVFTRQRDQMELLRVRDVFTRQQSLSDRWLGLGTVVIVSSEKSLPTFFLVGVDDPKMVMDLIWHHARAEQDQRSVKVEQV